MDPAQTPVSHANSTGLDLFVPKPTPWLVALRQCAPDLGATVRQRLLEYVPGRWDRYSASAFGGSGGTSTAPGADPFHRCLYPCRSCRIA
jgi:hypothetical protein